MTKARYEWVRADNSVLAGICSGLAPNLGLNKWEARILWLCSCLMFGTGILTYLICWICLPRKSKAYTSAEPKVLGGCLQIARRTGIEVGLIRCIFLVLVLLSAGLAVGLYFICALLIPFRAPEVIDHGRRNYEFKS